MSAAQILSISPTKMQQRGQFALLVRLYARSIAPISSRRTSILRRCHQTLQSRQFSSSCRRYASSAHEIPPWPSIRDVARPAAMWLAPNASNFNVQQVLDQLPRLKPSQTDLLVVLFFVTPKLAYLFDSNHFFHARAMNKIYGAVQKEGLRQTIVAVVDALPVLGTAANEVEINGSEGVAICISPGFDVTPTRGSDTQHPLISMTAKRPYFDGRQFVSMTCSAPVANTTFVNGQQNTLFIQNWRNHNDDRKWLPENKRHKLSRVEVPMYLDEKEKHFPLIMYSKIIKLTDPKVIRYSMGNIVRQVITADGKELAASHELEKIVPEMLKKLQKSAPSGDIKVFALVYPPELGGDNAFGDRVWVTKQKQTDGQNSDCNLRLLKLLVRGARLYRVTSGGAGWGKKAGLLSLEPTTELGASVDIPKMPSFIFDKDEEIRMPGSADLFPPGHIIQFIATFHDSNGSKKDATSIDDMKEVPTMSRTQPFDWTDPEKIQTFCIGNTVLPETHHYTSLEKSDDDMPGRGPNDKAASPNLLLRLNRFGLLTSSALGFSARFHSPSARVLDQMRIGRTSFNVSELDMNFKHNSLIELPNSYFVARFLAGSKLTPEIVRQYSGSEEMKSTDKVIAARIPRRLELTQELSVFAASKRLREIEKIQKDSYLARKSVPHRQYESGTLVRAISPEDPTVDKDESGPRVLGRTGPIVTEQGKSYGLTRAIPTDSFNIIKTAATPNIIVAKAKRARLRRIAMVKSFKVRIVQSAKGLPEVGEEALEHSSIDTQWSLDGQALVNIDQNDDASLRNFYRQVDGPRRDKDYHEVTDSRPLEIKIGPVVRIIESQKRRLFRQLGLTSGIFRVYSSDGVHWDTERESNRVKEAVEGLLQDL